VDWFDDSLYPEVECPHRPSTHGERIDFVARVCAAWDFGILPDMQTVDELAKPEWRDAVDACRLLTACSYHLLRRMHGLTEVPYLGPIPAYVKEDPNLNEV
jgi:hypothetical protein